MASRALVSSLTRERGGGKDTRGVLQLVSMLLEVLYPRLWKVFAEPAHEDDVFRRGPRVHVSVIYKPQKEVVFTEPL